MTAMIEVKVADVSGDLLNCLVATIERPDEKIFHNCDGYTLRWHNKPPAYSTDWAQGGPLIEKYRPDLQTTRSSEIAAYLNKDVNDPGPLIYGRGETYLIAACRAIVAAKLGDVVSVPAELVGGAA